MSPRSHERRRLLTPLQVGSDKKYCVKRVRDAFLAELASYPGDRSAFVEERYHDIKARAQVKEISHLFVANLDHFSIACGTL